MTVEAKLKELGIELPNATAPLANYVGGVRTGNLLMLSGHIPLGSDGKLITSGRLGDDVSSDEGYQLARQIGVNLLATSKMLLGDLSKVRRVVKAVGFIRSAPDFKDQPKVLNGFSDLMAEVFGREIGAHARSAVGVPELPLGAPVEVELILEVSD